MLGIHSKDCIYFVCDFKLLGKVFLVTYCQIIAISSHLSLFNYKLNKIQNKPNLELVIVYNDSTFFLPKNSRHWLTFDLTGEGCWFTLMCSKVRGVENKVRGFWVLYFCMQGWVTQKQKLSGCRNQNQTNMLNHYRPW